MKKDNRTFLEEMYENERDKMEGLSFEQVKGICGYPWKLLKKEMEGGEFNKVRLQNLGIFMVYKKRMAYYLGLLEKWKENNVEYKKTAKWRVPGRIEATKENIRAYLEKNKDKDDKLCKRRVNKTSRDDSKVALLYSGNDEIQGILQQKAIMDSPKTHKGAD